MPPAFSVSLRPAAAHDGPLLLTWRNDPAVRAASSGTAVVNAAEHARWLATTLADPTRTLLVIELDGRPVGQIRFDEVGGGVAEISISLSRAARGQGVGPAAIAAGVERLRSERATTAVLARVRSANGPSLRAFRRAGFTEVGGDEAFRLLRLEL